MESMKHFYKWYYSLSEKDRQKQLDNSKLLYPFNTWDMNYYLLIGNYQVLIDIDDIGNELEYLNSEDINDIEKETLIDLAWKIYE
jgi:hypothetical protein